jgi:hypothetical protein
MKYPIEIKRLIRVLEKEANEADWIGDAPLADELRKRIVMLRLKLELGTTHETDF